MNSLFAVGILAIATFSTSPCSYERAYSVADVSVWTNDRPPSLLFVTKLAVSADGAPDAYHPKGIGSDYNRNAGRPGNWWALVTDNGRRNGKPIVQTASDPNPGYYVSTTALCEPAKPRTDPRRYVDARTIPYFVLPKGHTGAAKLGDVGMVYNPKSHRLSAAIFADVGPADAIGEGSIRLANNLRINANPRNGGKPAPVVFLVFPGSGNGRPQSAEQIYTRASEYFQRWGGVERLKQCASDAL
jgi:hypothetical protein